MKRTVRALYPTAPSLTQTHSQARHFDKQQTRPSWWMVLFLVVFGFGFTGCAPAMIKGTEIPKNKKNQAIYNVMMEYQRGIQQRSWRTLLRLISPRYHETKGTPDPKDDYGYDFVKKRLTSESFRKVKIYTFYVSVQKIQYPTPTEAKVTLLTRIVYKYPRDVYKPGWDRGVAKHIMRLELYRGRWMIVRGF